MAHAVVGTTAEVASMNQVVECHWQWGPVDIQYWQRTMVTRPSTLILPGRAGFAFILGPQSMV